MELIKIHLVKVRKTKNFFRDSEPTKKIKLGSILEKLTQRHNRRVQVRRFDKNQDRCGSETCAPTRFSQIQKYQLIEPQQLLDRYGNALLLFSFNTEKYDFK